MGPETNGQFAANNQEQEARLIRQAKAGDEAAFGELYDRYVDRVFRLIRLRVSQEMTAEDLTSETFIKAWDGLDGYESRGHTFGAWLFRIARNTVVDHYRTRKDSEPLKAARTKQGGDQVEETVARAELAERLKAKLDALTDDQRAVLELKFLMGLSTSETAQVLGKRPGAIRALQMRALQSLARITEGTNG